MPPMISVAEARSLIQQHVHPLPPVIVLLQNAAGLTLATDIFSPGHFPPFRQSSMDGYAFAYDHWSGKPLAIAGEMQAGANSTPKLLPGQAIRIFTGAPVPDGVDTVVMQEKTELNNGQLTITDELIVVGANVRPIGSDIQAGELALPAGSFLSPGALGMVAGLGINEVSVYPPPIVSVLLTGKELQQQGKPLQFGQVYESNSFANRAVLQQCGVQQIHTQVVDDDLALLTTTIEQAINNSNLVLLTGGVSVGDYDFVTRALQQLGAQVIFHKLKQRPGKPLLLATHKGTVIFGLPGNPSSVLTCLYEYVVPALQIMLQRPMPFVQTVQLPLAEAYIKNHGLTQFLKGWYHNGQVTPLHAQESYRMRSFAVANCLIVLPDNARELKKGQLVEVHLLF